MKERSILTYVFIAIAISIVGYLGYVIYKTVKYSHAINLNIDEHRFRFFSDSAICLFDPYIYMDYNRSSDVIYHFKDNTDSCYVNIWEFKNLKHLEFHDVKFVKNVSLDSIVFKSGEVLNSHKSPEITVCFEPFFDKDITVNIDKYSKPEREVRGEHYHGYIGWINRFSLSNEKGDHLVLFNNRFDYKKCMVIAYSNRGKFYIVIFYGESDFNENVANILNM